MIALLRAIPLWGYILAGALSIIGVQQVRISHHKAETARAETATTKAKGQLETFRREAAESVAAAQAEARQQEQRHAADLSRISYQYEQEKKDAQAVANRVADDLRSGAARVHQRWEACAATSGLSGAQPSAGFADAAQRDREESIGRVIAAARGCDAQVSALQKVILSDRDQK